MIFQGGFMVFHGFWLVSMVFQGSFMVFHSFGLVSMVFQGCFMVCHGFWLVSMVSVGRLWPSLCKILQNLRLTYGGENGGRKEYGLYVVPADCKVLKLYK